MDKSYKFYQSYRPIGSQLGSVIQITKTIFDTSRASQATVPSGGISCVFFILSSWAYIEAYIVFMHARTHARVCVCVRVCINIRHACACVCA